MSIGNIDDLLLSDGEDDDGKEIEKNKNESPKPKINIFLQPKLIKTNPVNIDSINPVNIDNTNPVNIDNAIEKSLKSDKKELEINDKFSLPIMSSSSMNEEPGKKDESAPKSDLFALIWNKENPINIPKKIQDKKSNSSSISNKLKENKSGSGKMSFASSSIVQPPPPDPKSGAHSFH